MTETTSSLGSLRKQLTENKHELCVAYLQLNRSISTLERAEAQAISACNKNNLWMMAREQQQQAARALIILNHTLKQNQNELLEIQEIVKSQLTELQHFSRICQRALIPHLKSSQSYPNWRHALERISEGLKIPLQTLPKLKRQLNEAFTTLATGRQRRSNKIKEFQQALMSCLKELETIMAQRMNNSEIMQLQEQIQKKLEKKAQYIREIQRFQHVLDNVLSLEQQVAVEPARLHCKIIQSYIHTMQQQQISLLDQIKLLSHPNNAANDVLIDIDEPKPRNIHKR